MSKSRVPLMMATPTTDGDRVPLTVWRPDFGHHILASLLGNWDHISFEATPGGFGWALQGKRPILWSNARYVNLGVEWNVPSKRNSKLHEAGSDESELYPLALECVL
ncbi:hypothetical protein B0H11DRAFT_1907307 [Mycena galericulata]|nr:hypothetical protein B0H11DRAFT_1907307 [Mycena galericulata]